MAITIYPRKWATKPSYGSLNYGHPRANALKGYWAFIGNGGREYYDLVSVRRNIGTRLDGGTTPHMANGKFGECYYSSVNNNGSFISINVPGLDPVFDSVPFTVECWVRMDVLPGAAGSSPFSKWNTTGWLLACGVGSSTMLFISDTGQVVTGSTLTLGQWYHLCATYDGTTKILYINGINISQANQPLTPQPAQSLNIGVYQGLSGTTWGGAIDLCAFWSRVLSPAEIWESYNDPLGMIALEKPLYSSPGSGGGGGGSGLVYGQLDLTGIGGAGRFAKLIN